MKVGARRERERGGEEAVGLFFQVLEKFTILGVDLNIIFF
jgi:hypothetical protein